MDEACRLQSHRFTMVGMRQSVALRERDGTHSAAIKNTRRSKHGSEGLKRCSFQGQSVI